MSLTRRGLFATLAAAIAARFAPKPKMVTTGWATGFLKPGDVVTIDAKYVVNPAFLVGNPGRGLFNPEVSYEEFMNRPSVRERMANWKFTWPA